MGQRLYDLFDFANQWWHEITVEQTAGEPQPGRSPRGLERRGDSPPQHPNADAAE